MGARFFKIGVRSSSLELETSAVPELLAPALALELEETLLALELEEPPATLELLALELEDALELEEDALELDEDALEELDETAVPELEGQVTS